MTVYGIMSQQLGQRRWVSESVWFVGEKTFLVDVIYSAVSSFPEGGGGYSKKFYTGRLRPEVQPFTLLYTIFSQMVPLSYAFYWKKAPLSYTFLRRLMNKSLEQEVFLPFFQVARNKLTWNSHKLRLHDLF